MYYKLRNYYKLQRNNASKTKTESAESISQVDDNMISVT